jgi:NTP pyrophosphatase (non-canonical NTP hydrolase)
MDALNEFIGLVRRKAEFDKTNDWFEGSLSYLSSLKGEIDEVMEELDNERIPHLEVELGDVLWVYLNAVLALEKETGVRLESILERANKKFDERLSAVESGQSWKDIKAKQKDVLDREFSSTQIDNASS